MCTLTWDLVNAIVRLYQSGSHEELVGSMNHFHHEKRTVAQRENVARRGAALKEIQGNTEQTNISRFKDQELSKRHEDFMMADILVRANE